MRLLEQAETVLGQNSPAAAVVIAYAVLESCLEAVPTERCAAYAASIERWRALRNAAVDAGGAKPTLNEAIEVVHGIRNLIKKLLTPTDSSESEPSLTVSQLRGKYKYVPTSSEAFIQRKAEELDLEHG